MFNNGEQKSVLNSRRRILDLFLFLSFSYKLSKIISYTLYLSSFLKKYIVNWQLYAELIST